MGFYFLLVLSLWEYLCGLSVPTVLAGGCGWSGVELELYWGARDIPSRRRTVNVFLLAGCLMWYVEPNFQIPDLKGDRSVPGICELREPTMRSLLGVWSRPVKSRQWLTGGAFGDPCGRCCWTWHDPTCIVWGSCKFWAMDTTIAIVSYVGIPHELHKATIAKDNGKRAKSKNFTILNCWLTYHRGVFFLQSDMLWSNGLGSRWTYVTILMKFIRSSNSLWSHGRHSLFRRQ